MTPLLTIKASRSKHALFFGILILCDLAIAYVAINFVEVQKTYIYLFVLILFALSTAMLAILSPADLTITAETLLLNRRQISLHRLLYYRWVYFPNSITLKDFIGIQFFERLSTGEVKPIIYIHEGIIDSKDRQSLDSILTQQGIMKIKTLKEIKEQIRQKYKVELAETYGS